MTREVVVLTGGDPASPALALPSSDVASARRDAVWTVTTLGIAAAIRSCALKPSASLR